MVLHIMFPSLLITVEQKVAQFAYSERIRANLRSFTRKYTCFYNTGTAQIKIYLTDFSHYTECTGIVKQGKLYLHA
jgi:hypothetical protein